ncbi:MULTISPECIES: RNA polymerase sigma factor [Streptomyces]|uniref:RNA polymerase sigma factor n=1 Tax=Streptomyces griseiscabiei TaxID=2993540 RepID=A0ABU4L900_9ACTN|nr:MULTISPECIES: RNA polymerase sigma factor [Streptomyces]MBZ3903501.1 RNA polymerase sigma factor [Streptomyces griseiscabiei]MDX2912244.1 RNA polymerase sigma factor [Streptomyces griseiscabiei]
MSDPERVARARIRAGDREAFAELYDACARAVYNHAYRLTGDWSTAEEVMADTFLDAWRTRERLEPDGGSLKPWLLGMATNKARNAGRARGRRLAFLARRPAPDAVADFAEETAGRLDDARRLAAVRQVYGRLRRGEREVLALCVWAGLDYGQAAQALGVPVGTVRSRLSRARARLGRLTEERLREGRADTRTKDREPGRCRGEVESEAVFAAFPLKEIQEGSR